MDPPYLVHTSMYYVAICTNLCFHGQDMASTVSDEEGEGVGVSAVRKHYQQRNEHLKRLQTETDVFFI